MKKTFILGLLAAVLGFSSCCDGDSISGTEDVKDVPVAGITLNVPTAELVVGGDAEQATITLIATVTPENATEKSVVWSSSDENVATVTSEGVVTAVNKGTAIITATTKDGSKTATCTVTVEAIGNIFYLENSVTVLNQTMINEIAEKAKKIAGNNEDYSAIIVIPTGVTIDMVDKNEVGDPASLKIPEGMSVTFLGAEGQKPRVELSRNVDIAGSHSNISFENIIIKENGCTYLINQSAATSVKTLSFKNCEIEGFKSIARIQGSNAISVQSSIMENCIVRNHIDGYSIFHYDNANQSVNSLDISKSTFYNINRGVIQNSKTDMPGGVTVTDCTFNDAITSGRYFIDCNGKNTPITLKNIIIGTLKAGARGCRTTATINHENVYQTSDVLVPAVDETLAAKFSSNDMGFEIQEKSSADIFTDPANGDFTLTIDDKVGDPRWYKTAK